MLWALIVPAGFWTVYQKFPPIIEGNALHILAFLVIMVILSFKPIIINKVPVTAVQSVSLAVFLIYGLGVEIVVTQISLLIILLSVRMTRHETYRMPANSLASFIVSLLSSQVYYALGGTHEFAEVASFANLWLIIVYQFVYFSLNQITVGIIHYVMHKKSFTLKDPDVIWDGIATLMVMPIAIVMFILYQQMGLLAVVLIGIPLFSLSMILRLYNNSKEINRNLKSAGEFGHQLTKRLEVNDVLELFIKRISSIVDTERGYIFDIYNNEKEIRLLRYFENGQQIEKEIPPFPRQEGIVGEVWKIQRPLVFNRKKDWSYLDSAIFPEDTESLLAVPIIRNRMVEAVVITASTRKRAYEDYQMMIMDILSSYLGVAIENARHHSLLTQQSERCGLTKLYNYRYIERELQLQFNNLRNNITQNISVVLIDIDRFKGINDTYGHQSGNEILCQLAERLEQFVGKWGTLARYGGEEFIIVLPKFTKEEAFRFAETLRVVIANKPFTIHSDLDEHRSRQLVSITASIGVASAPLDAEDEQAIIRHADRAMYTGAKQKGRNKVAQYVG